MDIPVGFRRLAPGEKILATDFMHWRDETPTKTHPAHVGKVIGEWGYDWDEESSWQYLRKVAESPWVSVRERLPDEKYAWYLVKADGFHATTAMWSGSEFVNAKICHNEIKHSEITHWMPIPELPEPTAPPITIKEGMTEREVQFNKDGSIKVGCVTVDSQKFEAIVERRKEVMA